MALQVTARLGLQTQDIVLLEALVCLIVRVSKDMLGLHSMVFHVQVRILSTRTIFLSHYFQYIKVIRNSEMLKIFD